MDHWFYTNCRDTSLYSVWEAGIQYLVDKVESKFMTINDNIPVGFRSFVSPYYYLGPSTGINKSVPFVNPASAAQALTEIWTLKNKKLQKITV